MTDVQMPARPADSANKQTWVNYLAAHGMTVEAARGMTKPQMLAWQPGVPKPDTSEGEWYENAMAANAKVVDAEVVDAPADTYERVSTTWTTPSYTADPDVLNIQDAILEVMSLVGAIGKNSRNTQGSGYNFRGVDAVVSAVAPAFRMVGVTISPDCLSCTTRLATEVGNANNTLQWADVMMAYTLTARDGSQRVWKAPGAAMDSGDKAIGKACSVAYRIAMLQGLCIPTDEPDPDSVTYGGDDGYQTHGRGTDTRDRENARQDADHRPQGRHQEYREVAQPTPADKIREYTMKVMEEYGLNGGQIRDRFADQFKDGNWFTETDLDRLKAFGAQLRDDAIQDRAMEEQQAVDNVIGGLGATVIETPEERESDGDATN